jgi:hypothetical protein
MESMSGNGTGAVRADGLRSQTGVEKLIAYGRRIVERHGAALGVAEVGGKVDGNVRTDVVSIGSGAGRTRDPKVTRPRSEGIGHCAYGCANNVLLCPPPAGMNGCHGTPNGVGYEDGTTVGNGGTQHNANPIGDHGIGFQGCVRFLCAGIDAHNPGTVHLTHEPQCHYGNVKMVGKKLS